MRSLCILMVALLMGLIACAKSGEETLNYAQQIAKLQHYNETLEKYLKSLEADPEGKGEITQVAQLLENYKADLTKIPRPGDLQLKTMHGRYERSIAASQKRLLPPDDPRFAIRARRAITDLKEDIKDKIYPIVLDLLRQRDLEGRVPLKWPSEE